MQDYSKFLRAARTGDVKTMRAFKENAPHIFKHWGAAAAHEAARGGQRDVLAFMFDNAPETKNGISILYELAAENNHADVINQLVQIDPTVKYTPISAPKPLTLRLSR